MKTRRKTQQARTQLANAAFAAGPAVRARPPLTRNVEAVALIRIAQATCNGCRTNWRLETGTFKHPVPGGTVECWAIEQRQALRDIAKRDGMYPAPGKETT